MTDNISQLKSDPAVLRVYSKRVKLRKEGKEYFGLCPIHSEKSGSFSVSQDKSGVFCWHCFGCGGGGDVFKFVMAVDKISFSEAKKRVESELGWETAKNTVEKTFAPISSETEVKKTYTLQQYAKFEDVLATSKDAQTWLLRERGITYETAKQLRIGYRQDVDRLAGEANKDVADKGWVVFPCIVGEEVVSIKYRSIITKAFTKQPGMRTELFNIGDGADVLDTLFVCEGELDCLTFEQHGYRSISLPNASTKLSPEQKDRLMQAGVVILAGDSDPAGSAAMAKLWSELQERTFLLRWPQGVKDANQCFIEHCQRDPEKFQKLVDQLTEQAKGSPMEHFQSIQTALENSDTGSLLDDPRRLRFPWPTVDRMAVLLPGSVTTLFATQTGMGKSTLVVNATLYGARQHNEVVVNYQCELTTDEIGTMVAAHVLRKDRNHMSKEDRREAAGLLQGVRYYVGRNSDLTTIGPILDLLEAAIKRLGATVVVLDNLHYACRNEKDPYQAEANACQRFKNMMVKYGCKGIMVGQPRKATQQNKGKMVHITDWRGSAAGMDDADAAYAVHRECLRVKDESTQNEYDPITEVHLLKARAKGDGPVFTKLLFMGKFASFENLETEVKPEYELK